MFQRGIDAASTLGAKVLVWHGPNAREVASEERWDAFIALARDLAAAVSREVRGPVGATRVKLVRPHEAATSSCGGDIDAGRDRERVASPIAAGELRSGRPA